MTQKAEDLILSLLNFLYREGGGESQISDSEVCVTLGIFFFFLPFCRSPRLKNVSSGLLGVEGGLALTGDPVPSRLSFLVSSSLKFLLSEFCRKNADLAKDCCVRNERGISPDKAVEVGIVVGRQTGD